MRAIFDDDVASFHGEFVNFDDIWSWPKPAQQGGVPLIYGGNSPGSEARALAYADGWAPINAPGIIERVAAFTSENPGVPVYVAGVETDPAEIERYAQAGAARAILGFGHVRPGEAEPLLAELRKTVDVAVG